VIRAGRRARGSPTGTTLDSVTDSAGIRRPDAEPFHLRAMWLADATDSDVHLAFRADLHLDAPATVTIDVQAAANFRLWVDGRIVIHGPFRYAARRPEHTSRTIDLAAGDHALALHATGGALATRIYPDVPGFVWVSVSQGGQRIDLDWRARRLTEYAQTGLRLSVLQEWVEWRDEPLDPAWRTAVPGADWRRPDPVPALRDALGTPTPGIVTLPDWPLITPHETARGTYRETYTGYRFDDPAAQFLLADPAPAPDEDADGVWVRYDLGRIRIGTLELTVEVDADAEVTLAYADRLGPDGRPVPVTALATSSSRNIQHYRVAPGRERIEPLQAMGAQFVEVRVQTTGTATITDPVFRERDWLGEPRGSFAIGDPIIDRIWAVGVETVRANAEDALVDGVRERAEWVGDVAAAAIDIVAVAWGDLGLAHRALMHAAAAARADGIVAGAGAGQLNYLGSYAAQWVTACVALAEHTADPGILVELEDAARANVAGLVALIADDGTDTLPWNFIDWGYAPEPGRPNVAALCHVLRGVESWIRWQRILHGTVDPTWPAQQERLRGIIERELPADRSKLEPRVAALATLCGIVDARVAAPIVRRHLEAGFPFDRSAPRLRDPDRVDPATVTPYFTNFSMRALFEAGETDAVLDLWRRGWGWMLERGATTWWEVFDDRWSRSHFWSGSPTWQASRYLLGVWPVLDPHGASIEIRLYPGSLPRAEGAIPLPGGGPTRISWRREGDDIRFDVDTPRPLSLSTGAAPHEIREGRTSLILRTGDGIRFTP
jgi:alpha-L-rhamnosidase